MIAARRPREPMMDALDRRIVAELGRDGRAQSTAIGEALGVGGNLVAARIRTMEATGAVRVLAVADFRVHGCRMLALIRLRVRGRAPGAVAAELSRRADVLAVHLTSGRPQRSGLLIFAPLVTGKIDRAASALMFVTMRCAAREMKADRDALLPLDVVRALYDTKAAHRMVAVCEGRGSPAAYSAASISP